MQQGARRFVIGDPQQFAQLMPGPINLALPARLAQVVEQPNAFGPPPPTQQVILAPAEEWRDEQVGQVQVIVRLDRKTQRGDQVTDRQWRCQPQPVNPRHRHACGVKPRDDQPGQFLALTHQHHDIARRGAPGLALGLALDQREAVIEPFADLLGDLVRHLAIPARQPTFGTLVRCFALTRFAVVTVVALATHYLPQGNLSGPVLTLVRRGALAQTKAIMADLPDRLVDELKD